MIFDELLAKLGENSIHKLGLLATVASQVIHTFEKEFAQSQEGKHAAIDTVIELLKKSKECVPAPVETPIV